MRGRSLDTGRLGRSAYCCCLAFVALMAFNPARVSVLTFDGWRFSVVQVAELPVVSLALAALWACGALRRNTVRAWAQRAVLLALLCATWITSVSVGNDRGGLAWTVDLLMGLVLCWAVSEWSGTRGVEALGAAIVVGASAAALVGLGEFVIHQRTETLLDAFRVGPTTMGPYLRLSGPFGHANEAAMYMEIALCCAIAGLYTAATARRHAVQIALWLSATEVLLLALLLTYSRGALIGIAAAAVVMGAVALYTRQSRPAWTQQAWRVLVVIALAIPGVVLVGWDHGLYVLRFTTMSDQTWYRVTYVPSLPPTIRAGRTVIAHVRVTNASPLAWHPSAENTYALSYHWVAWSGRLTALTTLTAAITTPVQPGGATSVAIPVRAPSAPGRYHLLWDVQWDKSTWFGLKTGQFHATAEQVRPPAAAHASFTPSPYGRMSRLPLAEPVTRPAIWRLAVHTFVRHPLLGGGLHAFRGAALRHRLTGGGKLPPPTAHDVYLELLDDWGIAGTVLTLGLVLLLWFPLLSRLAVTRQASAYDLAVLGAGTAYAVHGVVDCFLGVTNIYIVMWVVSGIAARSALVPPTVSPTASRMARERTYPRRTLRSVDGVEVLEESPA